MSDRIDEIGGDNPAWMRDALCREMNPDMFYPDYGVGAGIQTRFAQEACGACPVRLECLAFAMETEANLTHQYRHGVWGGLTPQERHKLARKRDGKQVAA